MKFESLFVFLLPTTILAVMEINDTTKYPVCTANSDCENYNLGVNQFACFQYFCYPWVKKAQTADANQPLQLCRRDNDCPNMRGGRAKCFRHFERRKINHGVCVPSVDECKVYDDCYAKGGKCCNGYCCNEEYYQALADMPCFNNLGCKVQPTLLIG